MSARTPTLVVGVLVAGCFSDPEPVASGTEDSTTMGEGPSSSAAATSAGPATASDATISSASSSATSEDDGMTSGTTADGGSSSTGCSPETCVPPEAIAFWSFEGDAIDQTGNGHDGALLGGAGFGAGRFGQGLSNDGTVGAVEVPDDLDLWLSSGYTVEAWVRPESGFNGFFGVLFKGDPANSPAWAYRMDAIVGVQNQVPIHFRLSRTPGSWDIDPFQLTYTNETGEVYDFFVGATRWD